LAILHEAKGTLIGLETAIGSLGEAGGSAGRLADMASEFQNEVFSLGEADRELQ
jgi:hypothetical protein